MRNKKKTIIFRGHGWSDIVLGCSSNGRCRCKTFWPIRTSKGKAVSTTTATSAHTPIVASAKQNPIKEKNMLL